MCWRQSGGVFQPESMLRCHLKKRFARFRSAPPSAGGSSPGRTRTRRSTPGALQSLVLTMINKDQQGLTRINKDYPGFSTKRLQDAWAGAAAPSPGTPACDASQRMHLRRVQLQCAFLGGSMALIPARKHPLNRCTAAMLASQRGICARLARAGGAPPQHRWCAGGAQVGRYAVGLRWG